MVGETPNAGSSASRRGGWRSHRLTGRVCDVCGALISGQNPRYIVERPGRSLFGLLPGSSYRFRRPFAFGVPPWGSDLVLACQPCWIRLLEEGARARGQWHALLPPLGREIWLHRTATEVSSIEGISIRASSEGFVRCETCGQLKPPLITPHCDICGQQWIWAPEDCCFVRGPRRAIRALLGVDSKFLVTDSQCSDTLIQEGRFRHRFPGWLSPGSLSPPRFSTQCEACARYICGGQEVYYAYRPRKLLFGLVTQRENWSYDMQVCCPCVHALTRAGWRTRHGYILCEPSSKGF